MPSLNGFETTDPSLLLAIRRYAPTLLPFYDAPGSYPFGTMGEDQPAGSILREWTDSRRLRKAFADYAEKGTTGEAALQSGITKLYARAGQALSDHVAYAHIRAHDRWSHPDELYKGKSIQTWVNLRGKPMKLMDIEMKIISVLREEQQSRTSIRKNALRVAKNERQWSKKRSNLWEGEAASRQRAIYNRATSDSYGFTVSGWNDYRSPMWRSFLRWSNEMDEKVVQARDEVIQLVGRAPDAINYYWPDAQAERDSYADAVDLDDDSPLAESYAGWGAMSEEQRLEHVLLQQFNNEESEGEFTLVSDYQTGEAKPQVEDIIFLWKLAELLDLDKDEDFRIWVRALVRRYKINLNRRFWRKFSLPAVIQVDMET